MGKPIDELNKEHGVIMRMLGIMGRMAVRIKANQEVLGEDINRVVEFIKVFADKCHHSKEEDFLFPELAKNPILLPRVNQLLGEHKSGRDYLGGIEMGLENYQVGNDEAWHIATNMEGYIGLITEHIKTEHSFFAQADQEMAGPVQQRMEAQFEALEGEVIGGGKYEEYQTWLDDLSVKYS